MAPVEATAWATELLGAVPANCTMGLQVVAAVAGVAEVRIDDPTELANVMGAMHASGLITLVDAGGLAAIISAAERRAELDRLLPLGALAWLEFLAPARGTVRGRCALSSEAFRATRSVMIEEATRARFDTTTVLTDSTGTRVCSGTFTWSLRINTTAPAPDQLTDAASPVDRSPSPRTSR